MNTTKNNNTISWRVAQLEVNYNNLNSKLDIIRTNDLPHIQSSLTSMKTRINILTAVNIGAILLAVVVTKVF